MTVKQRSDYTFKYNKKLGRHGWLRLTPAYSVKLVEEIIDNIPENAFILDPFSGTATTGIVAAEHGFYSHCFDINPFLIWLGNAKCRNYTKTELKKLQIGVKKALIESKYYLKKDNWLPKIHNITRWWSVDTLKIIAALRQVLVNEFGEPKDNNVSSLAWISFCRLVIETSSAAFNHVSMSFHDQVTTFEVEQIESLYLEILDAIVESASEALPGSASVHSVDSREPVSIEEVKYSHVVTSPPYPNRISYIRELRPYMYWTKFLDTAREAGELDWKAIGGTWGIATSRLQNWQSNSIELPELIRLVVSEILETEEKNTLLMANYVYKYFHDMHLHFHNLKSILNKGAVLSYIVGNSSFYGVQVHTEKLLEDSLNYLGFTNVGSKAIRKRNSKKELFEYCVYATWK
ncbi:DNA methyltransferase [Moorena producens PAL-8-15-08-1]|uniref:site-specific DNA-methyltransferase (cytosine-N(4)-specific) n=1 Tax=Moorena producens PAL-8-15-08-1 TaxID=1458985 RepID=A0A1D8TYW6_9CYAN|nr:DNA adenine methylase [Moorena producens]AOX02755.1 DNA methyltransferase [Moorena producens PAL-8-15-08-1]